MRIPYQCRVGSGSWHSFTTLHQRAQYEASSPTVRESKIGASGRVRVNAPTTDYYDITITGS